MTDPHYAVINDDEEVVALCGDEEGAQASARSFTEDRGEDHYVYKLIGTYEAERTIKANWKPLK